MGTAKGKDTFSHDISEQVIATFAALCATLGPPKYRVLETAIETFSVLPEEIQHALKGYNEADRQLCFDLIRGLELPLKRSESGRKAKSAKFVG